MQLSILSCSVGTTPDLQTWWCEINCFAY